MKENPLQQLLRRWLRHTVVQVCRDKIKLVPFFLCWAGLGAWPLPSLSQLEAAPSPEGGMLLPSLKHRGELVFMSGFSLLAFNRCFSSTNRKCCLFTIPSRD